MYGHISVTVLARMYMYENFALPNGETYNVTNDNTEPKKATMNRSEDQAKEELKVFDDNLAGAMPC